MTGRHILISEYYFYPEGWAGAEFPRSVAVRLAATGCRVSVLCSSELYQAERDELVADPRAAGVVLIKVPRLPLGIGRRSRLLGQLWFCAFGLVRLLLSRAPDAYATQTNPPPFIPLIALISCLRRRPLVIIAQDLYPEVLVAQGGGLALRAVARALRWPFNSAYRHARRVVSLGPTMSARLRDKGVADSRMVQIPNWSAGEPEDAGRPLTEARRERVIAYTGNLGSGHEFDTLLRAFAASPLPGSGYLLLFVGRVAQAQELAALAAQLGIGDSVQLRPPLAQVEFDRLLGSVALAACTMGPGFGGVVVPSKVMGYLARRAPVLFVGPPGDIAGLLDVAGAGACFRNGDVQGVAGFLAPLAGNPDAYDARGQSGRRYYWQHLSKEAALQRYADVFESALRGRGRPP
jgi:glycosyltransferase involved in cell wall biosynthesis